MRPAWPGYASLVPRWCVVLVVLAVAPPVAAAQDCDDGRVRVDNACCWPEQSFDVGTLRCVGLPACPAGLLSWMGECMTEREVAATRLPPPDLRALPRPPPDWGLVAGGATLIFVGYTSAVLTAVFSVPSFNLGFACFPFAHAMSAIPFPTEGDGFRTDPLVPLTVGVIAGALEIVGAIIIGHAYTQARPALGPIMRLSPGGGGDLGARLVATF